MPISNISDLGFGKTISVTPEEMADLAHEIAANI
jgi:hypothetical protein